MFENSKIVCRRQIPACRHAGPSEEKLFVLLSEEDPSLKEKLKIVRRRRLPSSGGDPPLEEKFIHNS